MIVIAPVRGGLRTGGGPSRTLLATACWLALLSPCMALAQDAAQADPPATAAAEQTPPADADANQSAPAPATADEVDTLQTVRVTGIRHSIATSVETKNESTSIVEAISAEDIGKLPDVSIADSISRLPGLATQRVDGRSQVINIRGMSEQFAGTLLNGREQVSTGDSRGVEFDQYPAELINAVTVYKTPDASLIGQGLSGTVDLQTIRPLSLGERRIVFSGQGEYNSLGEITDNGDHTGYRAAFSYVDQFADDTIGVALGIARLDSPFQEEHYKEWWWASGDTTNGWDAPNPQAGKPSHAIALQGSEGWVKSRNLTRDGVMGVFEFKPNDTWHSVLDLYYSKFEQDEVMRGAMWSNDPWFANVDALLDADGNRIPNVDYANVGLTNKNGYDFVTSGTLIGVQPIVRNDNNTREDRMYSAGWNNTFAFDPWTFTVDLNYSRAEREQSTLEIYAGLLTPQNIDFQIPLTNEFGHYTLPDLSDPNAVYLWDPQNYGHDGRMENSEQTDIIKAARFDFNREVESSDFLRSYDVGVNFNRRSKEKVAQVYFADLLNGRAPVLVDPSLLSSPTSLDFLGMGHVLTFDPRALLGRYYNVNLSESNDDLLKDYIVEEDVKTFYAKANLDIDVSERVRLRGNVGVQYIRTDQSSTGFNANNEAVGASQTIGASYGDILPSMNLVADFGEGWMVRFGWAETMMRAPINYLSAASSASVNDFGEWSGSGGNPRLEPYRAQAVDLSFEKYIGDASYVALALFYKDLETYVYQQEFRNWDFTGYTNDSGNPPHSNFGSFYTWANASGGYMRGVELSTSLSGELFHEVLTGFGAQLNASYTESSIDPDGPGGSSTDTIPGLSKIVANATVYYERSGFSARLSQRYRDRYRGEYSSLFGQRQYRYTLPERQLDLQLSYDFGDSSKLHGLSLLFQVNNLNDSPFRTEVSEASNTTGLLLPEEYTEYGRQYLLGFRYEL
jgi:iron complex outermembrane receptor protein